MIKNMEAQKAKAKEKMTQVIDEYYEEFSKRSDMEKFTINDIEKLMLEQQRKVRESINDTNNELTSSIEVECKKNAQNAEE
jgi:hydroxymethylpyrimidine pyrophosphatase-like HAD family hydrolase